MDRTEFVSRVLAIEASSPVYRTGGTGKDGACDCIGLIMGALDKDYPMHSTNYFARYETRNLRPVSGADDLCAGDILFKARQDQGTLNERYLSGGRYDTGDRMDYYHAGVVAGTDPLTIVHCTQSGDVDGVTRDDKLGSWNCAGLPSGVEDAQTQREGYEALVRAGSGSSVNLRSQPSLAAQRIARVPLDTAVCVLSESGGWAQILTPDGLKGYMMKRYLNRAVPDLEKRLAALESRVAALEAK